MQDITSLMEKRMVTMPALTIKTISRLLHRRKLLSSEQLATILQQADGQQERLQSSHRSRQSRKLLKETK